jgi:hypothetical protein
MTEPPTSPVTADTSLPTRARTRIAGDALITLVAARLPQRVRYPKEPRWRAYASAMTVRMADTVRSLLAVIDAGADADGMILLRGLYEKIVIFCWIAIDPEPHLEAWIANAKVYRRKLHNDSLAFGINLLSAEALAEAATLKELPALADLALKVDEHWGPLLQGFRARRFDGSADDLLTFRGLYMTYRLASRDAHAQPESLDAYADFASYPITIMFPMRPDHPDLLSIGISLFAQALVVCHDAIGWPDPERVRAINDEMYATPA